MIERAGGTVYLAPALREVPLEDDPAVRGWLGRLAAGSFAAVVFLTGTGAGLLLGQAERDDVLEPVLVALGRARVAARGPKPVHLLKQRGVRIDLVPPEPSTSDELVAGLAAWDLAGRPVGVQVYGGTTPYLTRLRDGLARLGAVVDEVAPYRWDGPADERPVLGLISACAAGRVDALAVFSSSQIHNLFAIADEAGEARALRDALNLPRLVVAAIGPVTAAAIAEHGVKVDLQPEHPKMGHLLQELGEYLSGRG